MDHDGSAVIDQLHPDPVVVDLLDGAVAVRVTEGFVTRPDPDEVAGPE
jgi:hypothetical protein